MTRYRTVVVPSWTQLSLQKPFSLRTLARKARDTHSDRGELRDSSARPYCKWAVGRQPFPNRRTWPSAIRLDANAIIDG